MIDHLHRSLSPVDSPFSARRSLGPSGSRLLAGVALLVAANLWPSRENRAHAAEPAEQSQTAAQPPELDEVPPAVGHMATKFVVNERDPESSVPTVKERNSDPLEFGYFLQDLLDRAETAQKNNDLPAVIRFYRALAKAVPDNAKGWSKLCEAYEFAKDREKAVRACRYALDRPAVELQDYLRYVHLVLAKDGALVPAEIADLNTVFAHLEKQGSLDVVVADLRCELGVKQKDVAQLNSCTKTLSRLAPNDPKTVVFLWSLAQINGDRAEAQRLIGRAVKAGIVLESIERMQKVTSSLGWSGGRTVKVLLLLGVLGLIGAAAFLAIRRRGLTQRLAR